MDNIIQRYQTVQADLAKACREAFRASESVTLVAVSKTHPAEAIRPLLAAGQRVFGENRVQEAAQKWPELKAAFAGVELHLIGPLQTNKVRDAVRLFDVIETLDRPELAAKLASVMPSEGRSPQLFVQVNTGSEPQKAGILPQDADAFIAECRTTHGLTISGLMCIPPADEEPAPHFALLNTIARRNGISRLSMGMSGDYAIAIQMGATLVRIGTAIFGERPPAEPAH